MSASALPNRTRPASRKKVALLGSVVFTHSHTQHFLDRLAMGYSWKGCWQEPRVDLASVWIDQYPDNDIGKERLARYGFEASASIEDALTVGTGKLAVDGVVIICEHGDYPDNAMGQRLYPRYEWFKEVVRVFEKYGRSVPVFNDKHLATTWDQSLEMVQDSRRLGFAFLAGSSLPVTRRLPAIELPLDTPLRESVCVAYGNVDSYDFHAIETAQCMSERRLGGESGIRNCRALKGAAMWEYLDSDHCADTRTLVVAALNRSHNLPVETGYMTGKVTYPWARAAFPDAIGYFYEHLDGFRTSTFLVPIRDFNYAGMRADNGQVVSCQMYLPMPTHGSSTADFFNPLTRHIEDLVIHRRTNFPIERTLLTSGMTAAAVESLHRGGELLETPGMNVGYQAPRRSTYWRE
jgi:hypothetical protein